MPQGLTKLKLIWLAVAPPSERIFVWLSVNEGVTVSVGEVDVTAWPPMVAVNVSRPTRARGEHREISAVAVVRHRPERPAGTPGRQSKSDTEAAAGSRDFRRNPRLSR